MLLDLESPVEEEEDERATPVEEEEEEGERQIHSQPLPLDFFCFTHPALSLSSSSRWNAELLAAGWRPACAWPTVPLVGVAIAIDATPMGRAQARRLTSKASSGRTNVTGRRERGEREQEEHPHAKQNGCQHQSTGEAMLAACTVAARSRSSLALTRSPSVASVGLRFLPRRRLPF